MNENRPNLHALEPTLEPKPTETLYAFTLTPQHAKDIFVFMNKAIHDAIPENADPSEIDHTLEERRYVSDLAKVTRKFAPPPIQVAQDPDAFYWHPVALSVKELSLVQSEGEKRLRTNPQDNTDIQSMLEELDIKFNGAETKAKFGRTISRKKATIHQFVKKDK